MIDFGKDTIELFEDLYYRYMRLCLDMWYEEKLKERKCEDE